ncbi:Putative CBM21 (carbohydrate binding type-21) domain, CBM21 domain superfamily [Septoria linicola]|uniref:CBM21 (Carbohydrate binding type-21) domain, CBM21 domain superfamily n=1 Tax=Septoria linicola TaxID=215465 RepID=A0A9Q9EJY1_9PEZI|nr:putative CBM21 (carbohydrate binding type-21) domain, CBM21 domain superfamily [Septoria linicola]USW52667.1 Putative CBM21 (carbohydrate binding type-21) domain, CBM21 domain superfamily [Septoria linicola]
MPYTPPSQQSPASSKSSSPIMSRSSSYHQDDTHIPRSPASTRPQPPRSHSSTSYLHRHRRSPSWGSKASTDGAPPTPTEAPDSSINATDFARNGSIRQSPPPVNNLRIPTGAVMSPPDSSENSDGDDSAGNDRGRELEKNWDELQQAVRQINLQREGSPDKVGTHLPQQHTVSAPTSESTSPTALTRPALSAEARKISHSRSSTESKVILKTTFADSPTQTSDDSDEDEGLMTKPALVRKKSGELVKPALRPSSRRRYSSMPGTPTYHKSVHFNDSDNQTRHFLQVDKPIAVSAGSSPVETYDSETEFPFNEEEHKKPELEIKVANFPEDSFDRRAKPIRVERLFLSADKTTLVGVVAVQNISFHKAVTARFTLDYWKTTSEVAAEYNNDLRSPPTDGCDRFNFHIKLSDQANIDHKTLLLCVRYNVAGQEFWDSNNDMNYQIDFHRDEPKKKKVTIKSSPLGQRPLNAIPRSRHNSSASRGRQNRESLDDDFGARLGSNSAYSFGSADDLLGTSTGSIKLKQKPKRSLMFASSATTTQPQHGLGSRYDFSSSLSAALGTAQDKLGQRSGLMPSGNAAQAQANGGYFGPLDRTEPDKAPAPIERPDAITTDRPAMGSDQYKDLVQKFCYFTPGPVKSASANPPSAHKTTNLKQEATPAEMDGVSETDSPIRSSSSSGSNTPTKEQQVAHDRVKQSPALGPFISRSQSPVAPMTGQALGSRPASPVAFGYPYNHSSRGSYFSEPTRPTAIHG